MRSYLVRRLLAIVPTLLAVSVAIFLLLHAAPGGPMAVYANKPNVDPEDLKRLEASLGLHDPYPVQYVKWLGAMLTGNWGISYKYARPVGGILGDRLLATVQLVLASLVIASVVAIPVGVLGATLQVATAILAESALSYLGYGIQPPVASWGNMLQNAQRYLRTAPALALYPGLLISLTVVSINFLGDALRDALDPARRGTPDW